MSAKSLRADYGFTLIEVLVAMVIVGIMASIVIISVTGALRTSQAGACKTDFAAVEAAVAAYRNDSTVVLPTPYDLYASDSPIISLGYLASLLGVGDYRIVLSVDPADASKVRTGVNVGTNPSKASGVSTIYASTGCDSI